MSELPYEDELRYALCAALVLGYAALWRWHLAGVAGRASTRARAAVWYGSGALALALLVYALSFELKAYAFFAQALVPPAWFIASTLGHRLFARLRWSTALAAGSVVALVKPQFEAGRAEVGRGGVVRDDAVRRRVLEEVTAAAHALGLVRVNAAESPIAGMEGNREWLLHLQHAGAGQPPMPPGQGTP